MNARILGQCDKCFRTVGLYTVRCRPCFEGERK